MKIAYVLIDPGIGVFGTKGASVHVQEVIRALRADGHEVTVFCTRTDEDVPADLADLDVRRHRLPRGTGAERERAVAAASAAIASEVAAEGFDLVYERYSLFSDTAARLSAPNQPNALDQTNALDQPNTLDQPGELNETQVLTEPDATPIPSILEVNAPLIAEQREHRSLADEPAALAATHRQLRGATLISCVSEAVAQWTISEGADPARVTVTPNGVNTARITPGERSSATDARVTVGFVGTLKPWHGTDLLLRAIARAGERLHLDICGTGPQQQVLGQLAADLGIADRVRFRGAVAPEQVPVILHGVDIAVAPYPPGEHYFSPLKVYEYLAAGLPVVASAIGTIPEVLGHGELGVLVEPGNVDELAVALDELADDPARRDRLGAAAREVAVRDHDWRIRCRQLLAHVKTGVLAEAGI